MTPTNYQRGRGAEYRTMRVLEALGYQCIRAASSKGPWDVVGVSSTDVVCVQVKQGATKPSASVIAELREIKRPANVRVLVHYWPARAHEPQVWEA